MFGKFLAVLVLIYYIYIIINGILRVIEKFMCKKYYLKNRMNCKCFTCRFHKKCTNSEFKNKILKIKTGDKNGLVL